MTTAEQRHGEAADGRLQLAGAPTVRRALRTRNAAAFAGIVFSVLCALVMVSLRLEVPPVPGDAGRWMSDSARRNAVLFALTLVPFAGIAFLWFIGVVRDLIGTSEDRLFATVFLGSGLIFTAMLFTAAAGAAGLITSAGENVQSLVNSGVWGTDRNVIHEFMDIAMRMAAVFTIATSTILLRTRTLGRWLAFVGYAIGVTLLLVIGFVPWLQLLFPAWVLLLSLLMLAAGSEATELGAEEVGDRPSSDNQPAASTPAGSRLPGVSAGGDRSIPQVHDQQEEHP